MTLESQQAKKIKHQPLFQYFTNKNARTLDHYLSLDDSCIIFALHSIADGNFGKATELAKRYFARNLYKCLELPTNQNGQIKPRLTASFIEALKSKKVPYISDVLPPKSYKQYAVMEENFLKNILIKKGNEPVFLGDASNIVKSLGEKSVRLYFENQELKDAAIQILKQCQTA